MNLKNLLFISAISFMAVEPLTKDALASDLDSDRNLVFCGDFIGKDADIKFTNQLKRVNHHRQVRELDISGNNIKTIPSRIGILSNLEVLNISCNDFTTLPNICNLKNLQSLYAFDNKINIIKPIFYSCNIKILDLSKNYISSIPESFWHKLPNLTELYLGLNEISFIPPDINLLRNIKHLDLSDNSLSELPESIGTLENLTILNVSGNATLRQLPNSICNLSKLEILEANSCNIEELPENLWLLRSLEKLSLCNNSSISLPNSMKDLPKLWLLNLEYCFCNREISPTIWSITSLKILNLNNNISTKIRTIPEDITNLTNLEELNLEKSYLNILPENIGNLTNLKILNFSTNLLIRLPDSLFTLSKLKLLNLSNNPILWDVKTQYNLAKLAFEGVSTTLPVD